MTLKESATDLAAALTGNTVGGIALVTGRNLFAAPPAPLQSAAVFLTEDGGVVEPYIGTGTALFKAWVEVSIYGVAGQPGFIQGQALSKGVLGFLQQRSVTGYVSVVSLDGAPNYVEPDPDGRHRWTFRVETVYSA